MKDVFFAASALEGEARARYLAAHCSDAEMRREVEDLIEAGASGAMDLDDVRGIFPERPPQGLPRGTRLGRYVIGHKLGSGGMGWVYEATDEKLRRTVAVKVLPPGQIDEERRKRFTREAQSSSALNHPNIITVYEVGREGEIDFIAMERVAGRTLRELITARDVDTRSALRYASQIADALAAAHEAGLVHRDLKPGNVMVTERGLVKVLDFGLAKHSARHVKPDRDTSISETGQIFGTVTYMSPEQAEGKPVDTRSDIFSYGSLLFEMFTGKRAFDEDSQVATMAAILHREPPLAELPRSLPRGLDRILAKCLAKKPADRWQHLSDVKLQLDDLLKEMDSPSAPPEPVAKDRPFRWPVMLAAALGGAVVGAAMLQAWRGSRPAPAPDPAIRLVTADAGLNSFPALSKDGKLLAFASDRGGEGNLDIWLQQIGGRDPLRLTKDPADESDPAFSPDGSRIAFRSEKNGGGIYVIPALGGGDPVLVAEGGRSPRFSPDGHWIAYWTGREGSVVAGATKTFVVETGGGAPRQIQPAMAATMYPAWSPDGRALIVFGRKEGTGHATLDWWILPLETGAPTATGAIPQLRAQGLAEPQRGMGILWSVFDWTPKPAERLLFAANLGDAVNLWEFDVADNGTVKGPARRITNGPGRHVRASRVSTGGIERLAFANEELNYDIWSIATDGGAASKEPVRIISGRSPDWAPSVSANGKSLAFVSNRSGAWSIRLADLAVGLEKLLIFNPRILRVVRLSGNGSRILYTDATYNIHQLPATGGGAEKLCAGCGTVTGVSPDGNRFLYEPLEQEDLLMYDVSRRATTKLGLRREGDTILSGGQFSPDGAWVVFHALNNPKANSQILILPVREKAPVAKQDWIPLTDGSSLDREPCFGPDGAIVYFVSERDGFACLWARRLNPATKQPSADAFAVAHFHTARRSLRRLAGASDLTGLSAGGGKLVFSMSELTGDIWLSGVPAR